MTVEEIEIKLKDYIDKNKWVDISSNNIITEDFIRKYQDKVYWWYIGLFHKLSENFIREFQHKIDWFDVAAYQKLSENFIREFKDKVNWWYICLYQKLSENFIREFQDVLDWSNISKFQILSREFCGEFKDRLEQDVLYMQQFDNLPYHPYYTNSWSYEQKLDIVKNSRYKDLIQTDDGGDFIVVYKGIREDRTSKYDNTFKYLVGETYKTRSNDCINSFDSYGFGAWDYENAKRYCHELVVEVKIYINDITAIISNNNDKIRCKRMTILT